ncbi:MAG TPA: 6-pyruvoyl tetrahydropterin synthase family protein [Chromatiaceae bacterium]|nr:6-pyruvoyl tetrahydropterin synthase family protein [Chromatiaceae bacterium]
MPKLRVGVEGLTFDAAHYTKGVTERCLNLHGHTFRVDVEVEGEVDEATGMVLDFGIIKRAVREVLEEYNHRVIVPKRDSQRVRLEGPFNGAVKLLDYPEATTEYIALDIARSLHSKLRLPVRVKVYEGEGKYAIAEWGF